MKKKTVERIRSLAVDLCLWFMALFDDYRFANEEQTYLHFHFCASYAEIVVLIFIFASNENLDCFELKSLYLFLPISLLQSQSLVLIQKLILEQLSVSRRESVSNSSLRTEQLSSILSSVLPVETQLSNLLLPALQSDRILSMLASVHFALWIAKGVEITSFWMPTPIETFFWCL